MSLDAFMRRMSPNIARVAVACCGVSSTAQKRDLKNQRRVLEDFYAVRGVANVEEVGGGLNLKRPKFAALMDRIEARQISPLVIAHKDRLVRFGLVRAFLRRARDRVSCPQRRTTLATTGNGARLAGALLFRAPLWPAQLLQETQRGAEGGHKMKRTLTKIECAGGVENFG
jgi:DNA invertase Pin-like site-specific DNA recombinase